MPNIESDLTRSDLKNAAAISKRYDNGDILGPEDLPQKFYGRFRDKLVKGLPDFFYANGFYAVSAKCADVLRRFDLGRAELFPFSVFQNDGVTELPGAFFLIANIDHKRGLDVERSKGLRRVYKGYDIFDRGAVTSDGDIVVSAKMIGGSDLWVDPTLRFSLFFNARLIEALRKDGISMFKRMRCGVQSGD